MSDRPDPHFVYRRFEAASASADAAPTADGSLLLVGATGVFVRHTEASNAPPSADAPGDALFAFPRLRESVGTRRADAGTRSGTGPIHQIAVAAGEPVYAASAREAGAAAATAGLEEIGYRELYGTIGDDELALVSRAIQIVDWDESTRFCSRCGAVTQAAAEECVKRCPECTLTQYPRLAPAMIVGIVRDGKLLLGQSPRFRGRFHSILAGFLEPGETAEECVRREVYEEVGISVRNISYFGSQPWPFPHSLMLGFTAEHESGELDPDPAEIVHADWYAPEELPNVPGEVSISGRIINWFRRTYG